MLSSNSTTLETKNIWKKKRKVDKKEEEIKNLEFDASKEEQIMATTPGILDDSLPDDIINITTTLSNHNNEKHIINRNNLLKLNFNKKNNNNSDNIHLIVNVNNKVDKKDINQNEKVIKNNNKIINKNYEKSKKFVFLIIIFLSCLILFIILCLFYNNFK